MDLLRNGQARLHSIQHGAVLQACMLVFFGTINLYGQMLACRLSGAGLVVGRHDCRAGRAVRQQGPPGLSLQLAGARSGPWPCPHLLRLPLLQSKAIKAVNVAFQAPSCEYLLMETEA